MERAAQQPGVPANSGSSVGDLVRDSAADDTDLFVVTHEGLGDQRQTRGDRMQANAPQGVGGRRVEQLAAWYGTAGQGVYPALLCVQSVTCDQSRAVSRTAPEQTTSRAHNAASTEAESIVRLAEPATYQLRRALAVCGARRLGVESRCRVGCSGSGLLNDGLGDAHQQPKLRW